MCGIAGFVSLDGPRDRDRLAALGARMTAALRHRGPDGDGVHVSADGRVVLGATRLAVRDLSDAGDQPMHSPDGQVTLVYNGELYRDRNPAGTPPWPLRGGCDTEEFLRIVYERSEAALPGLDGMFAAAWHDRRTDRLVLARDHFGVKPLVWARVDGGLLFASEIGALLASGLLDARVEPLTFLHRAYVRMDAVDDGTWIAGVHSLEPAHTLVVDLRDGSVRRRRYWAPVAAEEPIAPEVLRAAFHEAVAMRRPSDVPMAAVVSGGVDSSAVFGALRRLDCDVAPYVVRYEGADEGQNEDVPYAVEVARLGGREPVLCDIRVDDVAALATRLAPHLQRPFLHGAELALFRTYERIAADRRTVVFSGHGSDELWGYQEGRYFPIADPARPLDTHGEHYLRTRLYRDERPGWHRMLDALAGQLGVAERDITDLVWERTLAPYRELETLDPHKRGRHHLMRRFLVYVNEMVDACSSAFSLEDRPSFQDVTLAEIAFGMPEHVKNREGPGTVKPFLKQAVRHLLPDGVLNRPKKGFPSPGDPAFRDRLVALVRDTGLPYDLRLDGALFDELGIGELMFLFSARVWLDGLRVRPADPAPIRVSSHRQGGQGRVEASGPR
ncbi:asparagine synthase (glutamine-hydrolyzing) [Actinoallomurus soli]|uniref:asparagine synthase (glutamine-hydrolyzing) n=1 Tax=Actinoallomurus soli TaxID=2952535 RepID=UPI00209278DC|nr:asparagine synthase (glutamine-hydrolyzing) [Actinoallomurus soli]MCO5971403.1 asparagine synthase (glutamine-hydrolyzing) [Actinoallomurus soli]